MLQPAASFVLNALDKRLVPSNVKSAQVLLELSGCWGYGQS